MKAVKNGKIVIIGAGHVGSHCGLSLMMQGLADEIVYIDIDKNKAAMQALDLDDMASNLDRDFTVRAGDYSDCADAHIVVMAAGKTRLPGQTRLDMFDDSIKMMNTIGFIPLIAPEKNSRMVSEIIPSSRMMLIPRATPTTRATPIRSAAPPIN